MLSSRCATALLAISLLAACHDDPVAPSAAPPEVIAAPRQASLLLSCTKHWKSAVSGDWNDPFKWSPFGVPGPTAVVCLDPPGMPAYTVTLTTDAVVAGLQIGGAGILPRGTLTFTPVGAPRTLTVSGGVVIQAGQTLRMATAGFNGTLDAAYIINDGTLRSFGSLPLTGNYLQADSLVNHGLFSVDTVIVGTLLTLDGPVALRQSGQFAVSAGLTCIATDSSAAVYLEGGSITGVSGFTFAGTPGSALDVWWNGGTFTGTTLDVNNATLHLGNTALSGEVLLNAYNGTVVLAGDIGPAVSVWVRSWAGGGTLRLRRPGGRPLVNQGYLELYSATDSLQVRGASLVNQGTLLATTGEIRFELDSLVNWGSLTVRSSAVVTLTRNTGFLRNGGILAAQGGGRLVQDGAEYLSEPLGVQTGILEVNGATLSGTGGVGDVQLASGTVEPGGTGIGTLAAHSLVMDSPSSFAVDLAGTAPGSFDQLLVAGQVTLAGTLTVREIAPFLAGSCGQVLPVLLDHSTGSRGAFGKFVGLTPGIGRGLRLYQPTDTIALVGYNPITLLSRAPTAVTVAEGGAAASYSLCLQHAPTADVTVTPGSLFGQLQAMTPVTFTPAAWALPRSISVAAIDDLLYEPPPQQDEVTHQVTSTDPAYQFAGLSNDVVTITDNDGSANLELSVLSAAPVVASGASFTLNFRVGNAGPDISVGSTFSMPASPGFHYVSATGVSSCTADPVTGISCALPGVANGGAFFLFDVTLAADAPGGYPTTYSLSSIQPDPVLTNNSRVQTITVQ